MTIRIATIAIALFSAACQRDEPAPVKVKPVPISHQLPTASEIFHLRSECVKLGDQILNDNAIGSALTQSQVSNYNEKMNRCYVELTVQSADLSASPGIMERFLFDGQTKELLASANYTKNTGIVFKLPGVFGYQKAGEYIDEKMADSQQ